jgi:hypothetical protein
MTSKERRRSIRRRSFGATLKTLTGDQPRLLMPILPPSTDKTPPPKPFG